MNSYDANPHIKAKCDADFARLLLVKTDTATGNLALPDAAGKIAGHLPFGGESGKVARLDVGGIYEVIPGADLDVANGTELKVDAAGKVIERGGIGTLIGEWIPRPDERTVTAASGKTIYMRRV